MTIHLYGVRGTVFAISAVTFMVMVVKLIQKIWAKNADLDRRLTREDGVFFGVMFSLFIVIVFLLETAPRN